MFQYAAGKALALERKTGLTLDHGFLEDRTSNLTHVFRNFDLSIFVMSTRRAKQRDLELFFKKWPAWKARGVQLGILRPHVTVVEPYFHFFNELQGIKGHLYLDGYWQSPKYFKAIENELRSDFCFREPILPVSHELLSQIKSSEAVCLNVRRGDFLKNEFHPVCSLAYYKSAIAIASQNLVNPHFFVFSDDKEWCRHYLGHLPATTVVGEIHNGERYSNYLQLMAACRHFIIPNSSYAWWAVWLANQKDNLVIAPSVWFSDPTWDTRDLVLPYWLRLPN